ncbi:MAG: shikimate dehydrogenase [Haliscomenobacter sp.]|nr:shikimate dehydrogenase [Haliscomenobacter sp.]
MSLSFEPDPSLLEAGHLFGLIGYPLSHSFSQKYFTEKFQREGRKGFAYALFPIPAIEQFPELLEAYPNMRGLNVTIPYKEQVMPYLDELDEGAADIGAVNVIRLEKGKTKGYNSDVFGFERSLLEFLGGRRPGIRQALVLGTGGASKAVLFVLRKLNIRTLVVSRDPGKGDLVYEELNAALLRECPLIVNTTPLGMSPEIRIFPNLPYAHLTSDHLLFDLIYNPEETAFLKKGKAAGAQTVNGMGMLYGQAEKAWEIWSALGLF